MPAAYPKEFRDDVVAVVRRGDMTVKQVAKDFGIAESCLRSWLARGEVEAGERPGATKAKNEELKALKPELGLWGGFWAGLWVYGVFRVSSGWLGWALITWVGSRYGLL